MTRYQRGLYGKDNQSFCFSLAGFALRHLSVEKEFEEKMAGSKSKKPPAQRLFKCSQALRNAASEEDCLANLDISAPGQELCTVIAWPESVASGKCCDVGLKEGW